jgi:hypothetical protein
MARTLALAHDGHTALRRFVRVSTSSIQPSGASSSGGSESCPHVEQVAIARQRYRPPAPGRWRGVPETKSVHLANQLGLSNELT